MKSRIFSVLLLITLGLLVWGTYQALVVAPRESTMGDAQRIFYYHVPAATAAKAAPVVTVRTLPRPPTGAACTCQVQSWASRASGWSFLGTAVAQNASAPRTTGIVLPGSPAIR